MQQGPTGNRVAVNVREIRKHRGRDLKDVSDRLSEVGRPININGLSKIENGLRRVDADDLIALAMVLDVTPDRLLIGPDAGDEEVALTSTTKMAARHIWKWVLGDVSLGEDPVLEAWREAWDQASRRAWRALVRPDSPSMPEIRLPRGGLENPLVKDALELFSRAEAEGIDPDSLVALYQLRKPIGGGPHA